MNRILSAWMRERPDVIQRTDVFTLAQIAADTALGLPRQEPVLVPPDWEVL